MRTGILGGTFNPPHLGHLRLAEETAGVHRLDRVVFIPCDIPPHKSRAGIAPAEHRLSMTRIACEENPLFEVSDIEIRLQGPSYTVKTLKTFAKDKTVEPYFILGTDSLKEICTWKDYESLFELSNFIVVTRPGTAFTDAWCQLPEEIRAHFQAYDNTYQHDSSRVIIASNVRGLEISSTRVRTLVEQELSIRYLVPDSVLTYIKQNHLYGC